MIRVTPRPAEASRLILVRHCETVSTARDRCYGSLDIELSQRGRTDVAALVNGLAGEPIDRILSSPRRRAIETATPIGSARRVEVVLDERLRELDFGTFEGRTYVELERTEPDLYRQWMEHPTTITFPGGEGYGDLRRRASSVVAELPTLSSTAIVTHGGVIRVILAEMLGLPDRDVFRFSVDYSSVSIVDRFTDLDVVRCLNVVP